MTPLRNVADVARWNLCTGCGACAYACTEQRVQLVDFPAHGIRPVLDDESCTRCSDCISVCPGVGISHPATTPQGAIATLAESWGPVLEVWEGFAADATIRHLGSSGGLATALALFCVETAGMRGIVHVGSDDKVRYVNRSQLSRTRAEMLASTGSRYSPASPCDHLETIEKAGGPCVFIGKPCDVHGLRKAQRLRPALDVNVGVAIGIFCAGTPSTQGTLDLLQLHGIDPATVQDLRYRGRGWPGTYAVRVRGDEAWHDVATYEEAWGFLQKYRPYRCHLCPDGTSEFADLSCGDPWYRDIEPGEEGLSLVLVRTENGRRILRAAMEAGCVTLQRVAPEVLQLSQRELQLKRGAIWGRVLAMQTAGLPVPRFGGYSLFRNWVALPLEHKLRSVVGTLRRIATRRYFRPLTLKRPKPVANP
jgi:coenzyme F420 hydrogenase subunit beta